VRTLFALFLAGIVLGCSAPNNTPRVTVYVSEDQVFSEPVLKAFEQKTGIKVDAIYDTEESKSTGVMNRLIAEKSHPKADVYWANEPIRAEVLRQKGILTPYESPNSKEIAAVFKEKNHYWSGFSARVRVLLVDADLKEKPDSIYAYTKRDFAHKAVIANPLFGTTTSHIAALFTALGDEKAKAFLTQMKQNGVILSTSNGESADFVADKEALFSLVDSDDAMSRIKMGKKVDIVYPDQKEGQIGAFVIPNVVMQIADSPHPKLAKKLIDFLLSKESEKMLAYEDCAQIPLHADVAMPKGLKPIDQIRVMEVDFAAVAQKLLEIQPLLKAWVEQN